MITRFVKNRKKTDTKFYHHWQFTVNTPIHLQYSSILWSPTRRSLRKSDACVWGADGVRGGELPRTAGARPAGAGPGNGARQLGRGARQAQGSRSGITHRFNPNLSGISSECFSALVLPCCFNQNMEMEKLCQDT